jgi:hypothetical protein
VVSMMDRSDKFDIVLKAILFKQFQEGFVKNETDFVTNPFTGKQENFCDYFNLFSEIRKIIPEDLLKPNQK